MAPLPSSEVVSFPPGGEAKRSYVRRMFTAIAPHYFVTAKHLGQVSNNFVYRGVNYPIVHGFADPGSA